MTADGRKYGVWDSERKEYRGDLAFFTESEADTAADLLNEVLCQGGTV
jgi:hypothetical protein